MAQRPRRIRRLLAFAAVALAGVWLSSVRTISADVERKVGYSQAPGGEFALKGFERSYDLHRPKNGGRSLVIFIHSRFWRERQADHLIESSFVPGLLKAGHSVAILRHRLLPSGRHPGAIRDVAHGVAALLDRAEAGEFDTERIFLAGHSSGAQLALLLALDPKWLLAEGKRADTLAGVISISGILETDPGSVGSDEEEALYRAAFRDDDDRVAASPSSHANPTFPSILFLVAARDVPGYRSAAVRSANGLRQAGHEAVEVFIANGRDHYSILELADPRNDARRHILPYLESRPRSGQLPEAWRVAETWRDPPLTTADFHTRFPELIEDHRSDRRFNDVVNRPFRTRPGVPDRLSVSRYQSISLTQLLGALESSEIGSGDWLEIRSARGEWTAFSLAQLRELAPQVVIGLGAEHNLFRATDLYHTLRRYSWVDPRPERVDMARPLGAFLYFPDEEPPINENNRLVGRYALTTQSFRLRKEDPFSPFADLSDSLRITLTASPGCLGCHSFRGIGGRAHHIRAADGTAMGGRALPLERYPAIVWKRFIFDQAAVAEEVGATAIEFEPGVAQALFDLLVAEKKEGSVPPWNHPERIQSPN